MIEFHDVYTTDGAKEVLWSLLVERDQESDINISHKRLPTHEEHCKFVDSEPFSGWFLLSDGKEWLGYVSVTHRNELGIVLFRQHRGKGWGRRALAHFIRTIDPLPGVPGYRPGHFVANINPRNDASIALFTSLGFRLVQHTYALEVD